jgi:hypothetical protein
MMAILKRIALLLTVLTTVFSPAFSQVDTSYIYNTNTPYGTLDLRIRKSESNYYYLDEGKTFSFRTENGQRTNTFLHMTSWDTGPFQEGQLREKFSTSDRFVMNYRLLLPQGLRSDVKYPIVFFLHGLQESGNCVDEACIHSNRDYDPNENIPAAPEDPTFPLYNNDYNLLHGGRNYLNARNRAGTRLVGDPALDARGFPGFAVFPQSNNGWSAFEVENALRILRLIIKKYNIDPNRVYINGLSKGGYGSFEAIKRAPWMFAAAALFSPISDANIISLNLASTIQHIPLWIFQGGQDLAPLPKETEDRIRKFRNAGMFVRYTVYDHLGHATWNEALEEPDFFRWLLGYTNTRIHAFGGSEAICQSEGTEGLTLTLPPGYDQYEWQLNGSTIHTGIENFLIVKESGDYRARFRFSDSGQWTEWSDEIGIGFSTLEAATFTQHGTLHLPDLNGKNEAVLEAVGNFNHYYWYRYEDVVDFPGDSDDTLKTATIVSGLGSGYFSLKVAQFDGCESPPSPQRKIFFNGKSPVTIAMPGALKVESQTASTALVTWKDNAGDEQGYEIWRRLIGSGSTSSWYMTAITPSNVQSFTDTNLRPSSKYEYKIRAVSDYGRSEYFPTSGSVSVVTPPDNNPPSSPPNLMAELSFINTIRVQWNSAADDSSIEGYHLFVNGEEINTGSADTTYTLHGLQSNTSYTIQVAAVDAGKNLGAKSSPVNVSTEMTGLFYRHTTGAWQDLKSIDWNIVEYQGRVRDFDLSPKRQEDFFNFRYDGFLFIETSGDYQFRISSNDGSRVRVNDTLAVENDGIHNTRAATGPVRRLGNGPQRITVDFFDFMNADSLMVEYNGPDSGHEWRRIESHVLKSSLEAGTRGIDIVVYPNPSNIGMVNVTISGGNGDPFKILISDALGKKVNEYFVQEFGRATMSISDLDMQNGIYFITVNQGGKSSTKRLVIMR